MASGIPAWVAAAMSAFVFAGSAQFVAIGLIASGAGLLLITLTTFLVNVRHNLYAATLAPHIGALPPRWLMPLAFWLTDETYVVVIQHFQTNRHSPYKRWFYLGSALTMYTLWQIATWVGIWAGASISNPASWGLDFALPATFIVMLLPQIRSRGVVACVVTAADAQRCASRSALSVGPHRVRAHRCGSRCHRRPAFPRDPREWGSSAQLSAQITIMADTPRYLLIILGMVTATYVSRYPVLYFAGRRELPSRLATLLRYVPPAVLISITMPAVLYRDGSLSLSLSNEYLIAASSDGGDGMAHPSGCCSPSSQECSPCGRGASCLSALGVLNTEPPLSQLSYGYVYRRMIARRATAFQRTWSRVL